MQYVQLTLEADEAKLLEGNSGGATPLQNATAGGWFTAECVEAVITNTLQKVPARVVLERGVYKPVNIASKAQAMLFLSEGTKKDQKDKKKETRCGDTGLSPRAVKSTKQVTLPSHSS
jgi:hypothetical protein